jgi:4-amino-4-deoxy-L-arabinose transferase-like glycosyltransferase
MKMLGFMANRLSSVCMGLTLCCVILIALGLRLIHLNTHDFWSNELFSIYWVHNSFSFLWGQGFLLETNPPFYFTLLKFWTSWFGEQEGTVRLLSVIPSVLCIPVIYQVGKTLCDRWTGMFAAGLLAIAPIQLQIAQLGRCYALLSLLVALTMWGLARILKDDKQSRFGFGLYVFAAITMIYTHVTGSIILAALNISVLSYCLYSKRIRTLGLLLVSNVCIFLAAVPELFAMVNQVHSANLSYLVSMSPVGWLCQAFALMTGINITINFLTLSLLASALLGLVTLICLLPRVLKSGASVLLVQAPALFILFMAILDQARPVIQFEVLDWIVLPLCLLVGAALSYSLQNFSKSRLMFMSALPFIVVMAVVCGTNISNGKVGVIEDWKGLVSTLSENNREIVMVGPITTPLGLIRYGHQLSSFSRLHFQDSTDKTAQNILADKVADMHTISLSELSSDIHTGRPVRLVVEAVETSKVIDKLVSLPAYTVHQHFSGILLLGWN